MYKSKATLTTEQFDETGIFEIRHPAKASFIIDSFTGTTTETEQDIELQKADSSDLYMAKFNPLEPEILYPFPIDEKSRLGITLKIRKKLFEVCGFLEDAIKEYDDEIGRNLSIGYAYQIFLGDLSSAEGFNPDFDSIIAITRKTLYLFATAAIPCEPNDLVGIKAILEKLSKELGKSKPDYCGVIDMFLEKGLDYIDIGL
jgi:hypothetical protein